jgi:ribosomal protein L30E
MNRSYAAISALALATLMATPAFADTTAPAKTRTQVRAELAEAIRTGDILANDDSNLKLSEQRPDLYAQPAVAGKSRAQVQAELAEAVRTGDIIAAGSEGSLKLNEQRPDLYPQVATSNKSRAEVRAELAEAVRTGDIVVGSEGNETLNQRFPGFYAQKNAVRMHEAQAASTQATRM